jgi:hypothetical protein
MTRDRGSVQDGKSHRYLRPVIYGNSARLCSRHCACVYLFSESYSIVRERARISLDPLLIQVLAQLNGEMEWS